MGSLVPGVETGAPLRRQKAAPSARIAGSLVGANGAQRGADHFEEATVHAYALYPTGNRLPRWAAGALAGLGVLFVVLRTQSPSLPPLTAALPPSPSLAPAPAPPPAPAPAASVVVAQKDEAPVADAQPTPKPSHKRAVKRHAVAKPHPASRLASARPKSK